MKAKRIVIGILSALAVIALGVGVATAATGSQVVSGTTDSSIFKSGQSVTVTGTVNGDVYCAGQTVYVDATVNGDVLCAGQSVTINGTVNGSVRAAGQSVEIGAKVNNSLSIAAQQVTIEPSSTVGIDAVLLAQSAYIEGSVGRDLHGTVDQLTLSGRVARDVSLGVNKLNINSSAKVGRNLSYTSPSKINEASGALIGGKVYYTYSPKMQHATSRWSRAYIFFQLLIVLSLLIMGLVLVALFPQLFNTWEAYAGRRAWVPLLLGFVANFVIPPIILVLAFTLIGIPLAILLAVLSMVALLLSLPISAFALGKRIIRSKTSAPLILLLGSVILGILFFIPVLGGIVAIFSVWYGFGAVLLNVKRLYRKPEYKV